MAGADNPIGSGFDNHKKLLLLLSSVVSLRKLVILFSFNHHFMHVYRFGARSANPHGTREAFITLLFAVSFRKKLLSTLTLYSFFHD